MHRAIRRLALAIGMSSIMALGAASAVVAAPPQPTVDYSLTESGCAFAASISWTKLSVDTVYATFWMDGDAFENHVFTMQAPGPVGNPNTGTFTKGLASFQTGALYPTTETHAWHVLFDLYSKKGVNLGQFRTTDVTVNCGLPPA